LVLFKSAAQRCVRDKRPKANMIHYNQAMSKLCIILKLHEVNFALCIIRVPKYQTNKSMTDNLLISFPAQGVGLIQLNRPNVLNALNTQVLSQLAAELDRLNCDDAVRCVVLTGSSRAFAAGADIDELQLAAQGKFPEQERQMAWKAIREFPKPLIAAVNGFALGGGCELMMNADIVIGAASAKFGQPEVNLGLMPGAGGTQRLTRLVGKAVAMKLMLSGEIISAREALRIGLISEVVQPEVCLDRSLALAATIASKAGTATRAIKAAILNSYEVGLVEGLDQERAEFLRLVVAEDAAEGISAFQQKRKPAFPGNK